MRNSKPKVGGNTMLVGQPSLLSPGPVPKADFFSPKISKGSRTIDVHDFEDGTKGRASRNVLSSL